MTTWGLELEWNTMAIQQHMINYLTPRGFKIDTILGFSDDGESALILETTNDHCALIVTLANERADLTIKGGLHGNYLPLGQGVPKFKKTFKSTDLKNASDFFLKVVDWIMDNHESGKMNPKAQKKLDEMEARDSQ